MKENDGYKDYAWIETQNGRFYPDKPTFHFNDIAHALSMNCRFNGHVRKFYSVAEHSVLVSKLMEDLKLGDPYEGLMHDATEAYLSDVPAPFKQFLPDWKEFDKRVDKELRAHYGLGDKTVGCKTADWLALFIEAHQLMPDKGVDYADPEGLRDYALTLAYQYPLTCYTPEEAERAFTERAEQLVRLDYV